LKNNFYNIF